MASNRNTIIICGIYLLAWTTILVNGKAIESEIVKSTEDINGSDALLPPLIFPTDKQRNNILPINKTVIKTLLHEDDLTNSSSSSSRMTKEALDKETSLELTSGEADDLRKTDQLIATSEEEHARYAQLHPLVTEKPQEMAKEVPGGGGVKDQVENIQEAVQTNVESELEEQFNRPQQNFISMSVVNVNQDFAARDHLAWISVTIVVLLGLAIYAVLFLWRTKLEQRYGDRHRLFEEEDTL